VALKLHAALGALLIASGAQAQSIDWRDCKIGGGGTGAPEISASCARFEVAENPDAPDGRKLSLNLAKVPARAKTPAPDPVFFLAGGPGQAAVEAFPQVALGFREILAKRDVILVDQRGTGGSNKLECEAARPLSESLTLAPDLAALKDETSACLKDLDNDPKFFTTGDYLRDLEAIRQAMGAAQVNLYGGSYGTRVGLSYLQAYPQHLRALILDGVVPQTLALGSEHGRNLDAALAALDQRCQQDTICRTRFGDLAEQRRALKATLEARPEVIEIRSPQSFEPIDIRVAGETVMSGVRLLTYQPESAALLPLLIHRAARDGGRTLAEQALMTISALDEQMSPLMELSVLCSEDLPFYGDVSAEANTLMGMALIDYARTRCSVWPRGAVREDFKQAVQSDTPVLLLSGEFDPVTPPRYAAEAAKSLSQSRHLIAPGQGHLVLFRGCMPKLAAEFLDTRDGAKLDAKCIESLTPAPLFTSFNGPEP
jgi:pimeloyl-ACP methyl ester carboxylesterase